MLLQEKYPQIKKQGINSLEIDGVVYLHGENLQPGQMVSAEIVGFEDYDLIATVSLDDDVEPDTEDFS